MNHFSTKTNTSKVSTYFKYSIFVNKDVSISIMDFYVILQGRKLMETGHFKNLGTTDDANIVNGMLSAYYGYEFYDTYLKEDVVSTIKSIEEEDENTFLCGEADSIYAHTRINNKTYFIVIAVSLKGDDYDDYDDYKD